MKGQVSQAQVDSYLGKAAAHPFATPRLSGKDVVSMMRAHGKTIRCVAQEQGITQKRVRQVRTQGVEGEFFVSEWIYICTGVWPKAAKPAVAPSVRVRGFWGAMFPIDTGVIVDTCPVKGSLIRWDQASPAEESWHHIDGPYKGYGSPIGVYLDHQA